jgi:hypothetical protein
MSHKMKAKMKADRKARHLARQLKVKKKKDQNKLCYQEKLVLFMEYFKITCEVEGRRKFNVYCSSEKKPKVPSRYIYGIQSVFRG